MDTQISTDKLAKSTNRDRLAHREYVIFTTMNIIGMADGSVQVVGVTPEGRTTDDPVAAVRDQFEELKATIIDLVASFLDGDDLKRQVADVAVKERPSTGT